jgi:uncharacterized protein DUF3592
MADSVTGIILLVLAGVLLVRGIPGVVELMASRGWREVPGTIVGSGVQSYRGQAGGGHGRAPLARSAVGFVYEVDGRSYTGTRAAFGTPLGFGMGLSGIAAGQAARYEAGEQVPVWVDPRDPANAVLRRSAPSSVLLALAGAALLVLGLFSL